MHIIKEFKEYLRLNESPDEVKITEPYEKVIARYNDDEAYAFGVVDGKMYISKVRGTHTDLLPKEMNRELMKSKGASFTREIFDYQVEFGQKRN